jgi:D-alanine-D-alanine ligase
MHGAASKTRVAVFFGGRSAEHDVSIQSGLVAMEGLAQTFPVLPVYIDLRGHWHLPSEGFDHPESLEWARRTARREEVGVSAVHGAARLEEHEASVAFLALHGAYGEDGRLQGFLETVGLPYTGSGVLGSALAMNKALAKAVYSRGGLTVAPSQVVSRRDVRPGAIAVDRVLDEIGLPMVVKPVSEGSSVGTAICRSRDDLERALEGALQYGGVALVEEFIDGRELTCGVLDLDREATACALPPTLIRPKTAQFFDYRAKYEPGASEELTPAPIESPLLRQIQHTALRAHQLLHLTGYSRTDMIERRGEVFVLETNTLPGLTRTSLLPQAAHVAGISLQTLLTHLVCLAADLESPVDLSALKGCLIP